VAIVYPLSMPAVTGPSGLGTILPSGISLIGNFVVAKSQSPYTGQKQGYIHQAQWWSAKASLPSMSRATAEPWIAFLLSLQGKGGSFLLGDPSITALLGTAGGFPVVNGSNQPVATPQTLAIRGLTGTLMPGDYFQLGGPNLLKQSQDLENAPWNTGGASPPVITADFTAAPDGTTTADKLAFPSSGGGEGYIQQDSGVVPIIGQSYTFSAWLKAASSVTAWLRMVQQTGENDTVVPIAVTNAWQRFSMTITPSAVGTGTLFVRFQQQPSQPALTTFNWGAQLDIASAARGYVKTTSALVPARLYKNLTQQGPGSVTLDIFPTLRDNPADGTTLVLPSPLGTFELDANTIQWDIDSAKLYTLSFGAIESF
jgi:hypothetical protein